MSDSGHVYSPPIQALYPSRTNTPTKPDPHLVELQAVKQILAAMVSQQDRLLTQLSTQQSAITRMEKKQEEMAFEILELRSLNHAQYDQLLQIHQDTTETKRHKADFPPAPTTPRCSSQGLGCFFANGVTAATMIPYSAEYMVSHFTRPCCQHAHERTVTEVEVKKDVASRPDLKLMKSGSTVCSTGTLTEPPGSSASNQSSRSQTRPLPSLPPQ
ncbi:hypothetical protein BDV98DRAFT_592296 [Pterulicium gracile]|uniref:Uncharacterized protein n=1 Tax=Pterulicium gracile TaxID=1884261 RepID=A0A5C3QKT8_9AGAR|nr:hypothetical protein BDV98DRAFT_592296 [Pterula gracilis]